MSSLSSISAGGLGSSGGAIPNLAQIKHSPFSQALFPCSGQELEADISKIIDMFQGKDLTKFFRDCLDYDFIFKSGN